MVRITLKYFYVFFLFAVTMPFSYTQAAEISPFEMTEEEFENYLGTLPRWTQEQVELYQRIGFPERVPATPTPKHKSYRHQVTETCNRQH
jgi:hypothetical protein